MEVPVSPAQEAQLDQLAAQTNRPKSEIVADALKSYLETNVPKGEHLIPHLNLERHLQRHPKLSAIVLFTAIITIFVLINRHAVEGYFSDDDMENLWLSHEISLRGLVTDLLTPRLLPNFRPAAMFYYRWLGAAAGLNFTPYIITLQLVHLLTVTLLWFFLRRLGVSLMGVAAGCLFFAFHVSLLEAYWKPMYVLDVLCGLGCMLSLFLYSRGHWLLSLGVFFLTFKAKEMVLMLPVVLLLYEWLLAGRRFNRLVPFFLISLSFGVQALFIPPAPENAYTLHFTLGALAVCAAFYSAKMLLLPWSAAIASILLALSRRKLVLFGIISFWILLIPVLVLPGRLSGSYLYVPLLGMACALADFTRWKPGWSAVFFLIWMQASYLQLRIARQPILAFGHDHRPYIQQVARTLRDRPNLDAIVYDGQPATFGPFGIDGLFHYTSNNRLLKIYRADTPEGAQVIRQPRTALITWNFINRQLLTTTYPGPRRELSFVDFSRDNPIWQLQDGWYGIYGGCHWIQTHATLQLQQPADASEFVVRYHVGPNQEARPRHTLSIRLGGIPIGQRPLSEADADEFRFPVSTSPPRLAQVDIEVRPGFVSPDIGNPRLGVQVCACGFK